MQALTAEPSPSAERPFTLDASRRVLIALACLVAGTAPLAARAIGDEVLRIAYGALLTLAYFAFALYVRRQRSAVRNYSELAFAFSIFALVQVLNNWLPAFVSGTVLRDPPIPGNPFASTISGTVVNQLLDTLIAIVPVIGLTWLSRKDLGSIYVRVGSTGRWLAFALVFFVAFYLFIATIPLRPGGVAERMLPTNGPMSLARFFALTPALLVVSLSNGFEEEILFRGLFLTKFDSFLGARVANLIQALIFAIAHVGVSYTPVAALFIILVVFPLGLVAGYLMRATRSVLVPSIFHGALDMAIYLTFLSYAI